MASTMPPNQPVQSTAQQPSTSAPGQQQTDPNSKQLDQLLKQNQINVKSTDDFLRAFAAIQQKQQLTIDQEKALGDYAKATIAKPGLSTQMAGLMKTIMSKKPENTTTPPAAGSTPPASGAPVPKV
jgi:predicted Rossmann fold nucleotide-binding protein DprA/Smf involved in DNA uptake